MRAPTGEEEGSVSIAGIELCWLDLTLERPVSTARGAHAARPVIVVRVLTSAGEGFGECAALAEPTYGYEHAEGAWQVMESHLVPRLLAEPPGSPAGLMSALAGLRGHRMAKAAIEMALLDADLRAAGLSLAEHLGVSVDRVPAGAVVGRMESQERLVEEVARLADGGALRVRIKWSAGDPNEWLRAVRERFPELLLQVDANGSYRPSGVAELLEIDSLGLACIEQPFGADDLLAHAWLAERISTPVCLDESLSSPERVAEAVSLGACSLACLKPACLGGFAAALEARETCLRAGVGMWCGGMFETSFARIANAAFAALPGFVLPGDLSTEARFVEGDLLGPSPEVPSPAGGMPPGTVRVHRGPGVAPPPDPSALARLASRREWFPAS